MSFNRIPFVHGCRAIVCLLTLWCAFFVVASVAQADGNGGAERRVAGALAAPDMYLGGQGAARWDGRPPAVAPRPIFADWFAIKDRLERHYGFSFVVAYSALYQHASDTAVGSLEGTRELREIYDYLNLTPPSPGLQKEAAGGIAELYGKWTFVGRGTANAGFIGFGIENRHRLGTAVNPQTLFLDNGSLWPTGTAYGEFDTGLLDLYYEQRLHDGKFGFRVGKFLPFSVYDYFSLKNPKASFNDFSFSLTPAVAWATWGMGVTAYFKPTAQSYINAGVHDVNGGPQRGVETFFREREYFTVVDVGYNTRLSSGNGNIHAMFWHTDARKKLGTDSARGVTVAGEQHFGHVLPFLRYAYQDGTAAALRHFVAGGVGLKEMFGRADDVFGIGFGWGEPALKELFVTNQKSFETFYRVQLSKELSVTAGLTYIKDPPLNLVEDKVTVFSLRGRAQF